MEFKQLILSASFVVVALVGLRAADSTPLIQTQDPVRQVRSIAERIDEVHLFSKALNREMRCSVFKPPGLSETNASRFPVLTILHGRGRHHKTLVDDEETRGMLLDAGIWVVLPDGEDGWYINSQERPADKYSDYLEEVTAAVSAHYHLTARRERRAIAGWSMGGYGAVIHAETHPYSYAVVASIIGLLDFPSADKFPDGFNYNVPQELFGADKAVWAELNPLNSVERLRGMSILIITGDTAFDRCMNERFSTALAERQITHGYSMVSGGHTFHVVKQGLHKVLAFLSEQMNPALE